ncbi:unnamed protein product [Pseudo-nitzschia multistriata]|uniref:Uncharacterized protein n=1 Tax=Pseudo-nitzschia multistriata TaxID=183589 RepID=A0A448YUR9_9STRA|nr:unnamed protein product [Pseudo-nitzschia multistriata]
MGRELRFVIGHTLETIPPEDRATRTVQRPDGSLDSSPMGLDWTVYLDVLGQNPRDVLARVKADFGRSFLRRRRYEWNRPRRVFPKGKNGDGSHHCDSHETSDERNENENGTNGEVWRCFESRQRCAGTPTVTFSILGLGGTELDVDYHPSGGALEGIFCEPEVPLRSGPTRRHALLRPLRLPADRAFSVARRPCNPCGDGDVDTDKDTDTDIDGARAPARWWEGEAGLEEIKRSVPEREGPFTSGWEEDTDTVVSIRLFGPHPDRRDLENTAKLCQNFVKHEGAIDRIAELCRGEGAGPEPWRAVSNLASVQGGSNRERHEALDAAAGSWEALVRAANPGGEAVRYKPKLTTESETGNHLAEFAFSGVPAGGDPDRTLALVRFCVLFVHNTFRHRKPRPLRAGSSVDRQMECLFANVVRDRFVEEELTDSGDDFSCELGSLVEEELTDSGDDFSCEIGSLGSCLVTLGSSATDVFETDDPGDSSGTEHTTANSEKRALPELPVSGKRPRLVSPSLSCPIGLSPKPSLCPLLLPGLAVAVLSDLSAGNKALTAAKLATMGVRLGTGKSNNKATRLDKLQKYFAAREHELQHLVDGHEHDTFGIEIASQKDGASDKNTIRLLRKGGRTLETPRRSVCDPKTLKGGEATLGSLTEEDARSLCAELLGGDPHGPEEGGEGPPRTGSWIERLDACIEAIRGRVEGAGAARDPPDPQEPPQPPRFALVHDFF